MAAEIFADLIIRFNVDVCKQYPDEINSRTELKSSNSPRPRVHFIADQTLRDLDLSISALSADLDPILFFTTKHCGKKESHDCQFFTNLHCKTMVC